MLDEEGRIGRGGGRIGSGGGEKEVYPQRSRRRSTDSRWIGGDGSGQRAAGSA